MDGGYNTVCIKEEGFKTLLQATFATHYIILMYEFSSKYVDHFMKRVKIQQNTLRQKQMIN